MKAFVKYHLIRLFICSRSIIIYSICCPFSFFLFPALPVLLQVCPSWYHVPCSWQDCRDGGCWDTVCQFGEIYSLLYDRTCHPWFSCAACHLLYHHKEEPIHLPLGNIHSSGNSLRNKLQVINSPLLTSDFPAHTPVWSCWLLTLKY